ncbi:hypothetical protein pb186bvf_015156 [Paramecium bursaria]
MLEMALNFNEYLIETFTDYNVVIKNWKSDIMVQLRSSQYECDINEQQLNLYTWPGISSRDNYFSLRHLKYFSDQDGNKFTLCAQFVQRGQLLFTTLLIVRRGNCVGLSDVCPIYDFGFGDPPKDAIEQENGFWISRQSDEHLHIVDIIVGEGEGMCTNPQLLPITQGREDFALMNRQKVDCLRDERFIKILSTPETKFYKVNDMISTIQQFKNMEIDDKYQWNLYKRPYIHWKLECRDQELKYFLSQAWKQESIQTIWGFIILILTLAIIFSVCSIMWSGIIEHDWIIYDQNDEEIQIQLLKKENITKFLVYFIFIGLIIYSSYQIQFYMYNAKECSDKFTNFLLQQQIHKLDLYFQKQSKFIVFLVILIIGDLTLIIIFLINFMQNRIIDNQYQQLNNNNHQNENIPVNQPDNPLNLDQDQQISSVTILILKQLCSQNIQIIIPKIINLSNKKLLILVNQ